MLSILIAVNYGKFLQNEWRNLILNLAVCFEHLVSLSGKSVSLLPLQQKMPALWEWDWSRSKIKICFHAFWVRTVSMLGSKVTWKTKITLPWCSLGRINKLLVTNINLYSFVCMFYRKHFQYDVFLLLMDSYTE